MNRYILLLLLFFQLSFGSVSGQSRSVHISMSGSGCLGGTVSFSASVDGGAPLDSYTCHWFHVVSGQHLPCGTGLSFSIPSVQTFHGGDYFCVVTDIQSGRETLSSRLRLTPLRLTVTLPDAITVSSGESVTIAALDNSGTLLPPGQVTWYLAGSVTPLPGGSGVNPLPFTSGASTSGFSSLRAVYRDGSCTTSDSSLLIIKKNLLFRGGPDDGFSRVSSAFQLESTTPSERDYCSGEPLSFHINALSDGGSSLYSYRWYHLLQNPVLVSESDRFTLSPAQASDAGAYYCEVRNSDGVVVTSDTFRLNYKALRISLSNHLFYGDQGEPFSLKAYNSDHQLLGGDSLMWCLREHTPSTPGSIPDCSGASNFTPDSLYRFLAGASSQIVTASFTSYKGCVASDSALIHVKPHHLCLGGPDDGFSRVGADFTVERLFPLNDIEEYCEGGNVGFKASVTGENNANYQFLWWKAEQPVNRLISQQDTFLLAALSLSDAGIYFCEARDVNGASAFTDSVLLTPHEVHLPPAVYASAGESLSFTATNVTGEAITSPLEWFEQFDNDGIWSPLGTDANPLSYLTASGGSKLKVVSRLGGTCNASDSTSIIIRDNFIFTGGDGDGYDASQLQPRIITPFLPGQFCSVSDSTSLQVTAEGSNLRYRWEIWEGDWTPVTHTYSSGPHTFSASGFNSSTLILTGLSEDFRGRFRCVVFNDAGSVTSGVTSLTGHHRLKATVTPEIVRLGNEVNASVTVSLVNGVKPWGYRYQTPRQVKRSRTGLLTSTDLFTVSDLGKYSLFYLSDSLGCEKTDSLPVVEVTSYKIPKITISGGGELCSGSLGMLSLHITDGIGPWEVTLFKDGLPADDLGVEWPLRIEDTNRDMGLWFTLTGGGTYTVDTITDLNQGGKAWGGETSGEAVFIARDPDLLQFNILRDNHIGSCRPADLFSLLVPQVNGVIDLTGSFFIDGNTVVDPRAWSPVPGEHTIRYVQRENSQGCSSSREVNLVADILPVVSLITPQDLCERDVAELQVSLSGNNTSCLLQRERVSRTVGGNSMTSFTVGGGAYREDILFLPSDSCLIYSLQNISDKHGCAGSANPARDTVYNRLIPSLRLQTRYPDTDTQSWLTHTGGDTLYTWGDGVGVQALAEGTAPFTIKYTTENEIETPLDHHHQTTLSVAGTYLFSVSDRYCRGDKDAGLTIQHLTPLYVRLKVLLEQPAAVVQHERELTVDLYRDERLVSSVSCFVLSDGTVIDGEGNAALEFGSGDLKVNGSYFLVVSSPGYLPVRSKRAFTLSDDPEFSSLIDFTDGGSVFFSDGDLERHMTRLGERDGKVVWGLSMVENNENSLISVKDYVVGQELRLRRKGVESESEIRLTKKNRDKFSEVPASRR